MGRELKIEGEVYNLTADLARRLGKSELEVVELALRSLGDCLPLEQAASARGQSDFVQRILALGEQARRELPPGATSDHRDLYDENGLPR